MQIDRTSPLPFYAQLKQILLADIAERGLVPGDRFRSDHEIADRFGVSRSVVRQALAELEADGVIERSKGRGTFIARQKVGEGLARSLRGLHEDAALRGSQVTSTVLRQEVVPAPPAVGSRLGLAQDASVVVIERLRRRRGPVGAHDDVAAVGAGPGPGDVRRLPPRRPQPVRRRDRRQPARRGHGAPRDRRGVRVATERTPRASGCAARPR
ncbi:GntR family transcriptional regulator [Nigerium sp.]|uniref:GntR family transcriptional regulator n=1 Tax=Nigerium sp. TaxID=2042655 RepID=UPI0032216A14